MGFARLFSGFGCSCILLVAAGSVGCPQCSAEIAGKLPVSSGCRGGTGSGSTPVAVRVSGVFSGSAEISAGACEIVDNFAGIGAQGVSSILFS